MTLAIVPATGGTHDVYKWYNFSQKEMPKAIKEHILLDESDAFTITFGTHIHNTLKVFK